MNDTDTAAGAMEAFVDAWRRDPEFRAHVEADPKAELAERGVPVPPGEVRLAVDTADTRHVVFPPDPNGKIADEQLSAVAGGLSYGSFGALVRGEIRN